MFETRKLLSFTLTALLVGSLLMLATPLQATIKFPKGDNEADELGGSGWVCFDIGADEAKEATHIRVQMKNKKDADNEDIDDDEVRRIRITKIRYTKDGEEVEEDLNPEGTSAAASAAIPEDADLSEDVCIYISMHDYVEPTAEHPHPVGTESPAPPGEVKVNYNLLGEDAKVICSANAGTTTTMIDGDEAVSVLTIAETQLGLSDTDFDEPDLILQSIRAPLTGAITFIPVGEFRFSGVPNAIHIFDADGTNLVTSGDIEIGDASITSRGEVAVPVLDVYDPENFPSWAMIVRGVDVILDDDADANSTHCYTVGGSSLVEVRCNNAAIADGTRVLDNWETHTWEPTFTLGVSTVPVWDDQEQEEVDHRVGNDSAWVVGGADNTGYLPGLVLTGNDTGSISAGSVVFRPLYGFQFVEDENTELYFVDAANGNHVSGDVTANMTVNSDGALVIEIENLGQAANLQLRMIVVNPSVSYDDPVDFGVAYFMNVYGSALGGPMHDNSRVLEGYHLNPNPPLEPGEPLPSEPVSVHGWTAAASLND